MNDYESEYDDEEYYAEGDSEEFVEGNSSNVLESDGDSIIKPTFTLDDVDQEEQGQPGMNRINTAPPIPTLNQIGSEPLKPTAKIMDPIRTTHVYNESEEEGLSDSGEEGDVKQIDVDEVTGNVGSEEEEREERGDTEELKLEAEGVSSEVVLP